mmetsp:Transcript_94959/g.268200  ORF Transcript_94959/g.268200 Transcript_94959/m.268200 type:complete len:531 (+) Transcript_94959:96-1688(+)
MVPYDDAVSLQPGEMEHIRRVFDEDEAGRKFASVVSPREDAQTLRSTEKVGVPCEAVTELYELLWRWGHRNTDHQSFASNFGFAIPDTIVVMKGRVYAWYFVSKRDGSLLRKTEGNLSVAAIEKKLCSEKAEGESPFCAVWLPMATQFPEARCHSPHAEFFSFMGCRHFLASLRPSHSGILQAFVEPHGISNFLVRTVQFRRQTSLCVRTNRLLMQGKGNLFDRAATFEGWPGLSSSSSRYRCHKHPHMEELILAAGETLNRRIEQERVRQMLFLGPQQHVALHFKVTKDHMLFFIYASVVSEREVILQSRPRLLMGDPCMSEPLPLAALLPGGSDRRMSPHHAPACLTRGRRFYRTDAVSSRENSCEEECTRSGQESDEYPDSAAPLPREVVTPRAPGTLPRPGSLPPVRLPPPQAGPPPGRTPRRPLSERRQSPASFVPRMNDARPEVPEPPYRLHPLPHHASEVGRYEYPPPFLGVENMYGSIKHRLVAHSSPSAAGQVPSGKPPLPTPRVEPTPQRQEAEVEVAAF